MKGIKGTLILLVAVLLCLPAVGVEKKEQDNSSYVHVDGQGRMTRQDNASSAVATAGTPGVVLKYDVPSDGNDQKSRRATVASHPDRIIVKYKKGKNARTTQALSRTHNLRQLKYSALADIHVYKMAEPGKKDAILKALNADASVLYAEPDYLVEVAAVPNDPSYASLWGLHSGSDIDIDAPEAWDISTGGSDVVVGVIDTGVDYTHPDLAANMWQNSGEIAGDGIDNDGNGFIDDIHGINAITNSGDPMDDHYHGTHCAGTIGAVGNNGIGVVGVCWNVKIMALKFLSASGSGYNSNAVTCIEYAVAQGVDVMSNSWGGGGYSHSLADAITAAENAGILFVAAAGNSAVNNDSSPHYPSSYSQDIVLAVAATDRYENMASFSCYGPTSVDVAAPGVGIYSTAPGSSYRSLSGTSMATPHVAGLAALLKANEPGLTGLEIKNRIMATVEKTDALEGNILTGGRVNAYYALTNAPFPEVTLTNPLNETIISGTVTMSATPAAAERVARIEFYMINTLKASVESAPWEFDFDTTAELDGTWTLKAVLVETSGRTTEHQIRVLINNSGTPAALITAPDSGSVISGNTHITAQAAHNGGVARVEFFIGEVSIGQDATAPYELDWNSTTIANGYHSLIVRAYGSDTGVGQDNISISTSNTQLPAAERAALIAFYNSTNGDFWTDNSNWKKEDGSFNDAGTEHLWYGLTIVDNHVTVIKMWQNYVIGSLPSALADLTHLERLDFYKNYISGPLPVELASITTLKRLEFYQNYLNGSIPVELCSLPNLEILELCKNQMSGTLPPQLGNLTTLRKLSLGDNNFTGPIPAELGNLTNVTLLYLGGCQLTGTIPPELGNMISMSSFNLSRNQLTGTIPPELGTMTNVYLFCVPVNQLTGTLPPELANITNMQYMFIRNNQLTGTIPAEFVGHPKLYSISAAENNFTSIPPVLGQMTTLGYFSMDDNQLVGTIPAGLGNLDNLYCFRVENNMLVGAIPAEMGDMAGLQYLNLAGNNLAGQIPASIGNLTLLLSLYLQDNRFNGCIPTTLGNLTDLLYMRLNGNRLTGLVPASFLDMESLHTSITDLGYNGLLTKNTELRNFLDDKDSNWASTQTIFPSAVAVTAQSATSVEVSWSPITYTSNTGGYMVYHSTSPAGPYTYYDITANKSVTSMMVTGLQANTQYYFRIRTRTTSCAANQSTVDSGYSAQATCDPIVSGSLEVLSPNGGEVFDAGTTRTISWSSAGISGGVNIHYATAGVNGTFVTVATGVANTGSFQWNVPEADSGTCVVRIADASGSVSDTSDGVFTIAPQASITVISPNGGERWQRGQAFHINWSVSGISGNVTIDLYKAGSFYSTLATVPAASCDFNWSIPANHGRSDTYKIRVHQSGVFDESDAYFSVTKAQGYYMFHGNDYNGDNIDDIAIFRPSNGRWCVKGQPSVAWGAAGDIPVPGDYNGDGTTDMAIFRPSIGRWCIKGQASIGWGTATDIPVPGDYNGDGTTDIAIYRPSIGRWCIRGQASIGWGTATDIPVPGDYNGDGSTDIAIYRPSIGRWCIRGQASQAWGTATDIAVPADYNGDGSTDIAIFRPSNGTWAIKGQPSQRYGASTDVPLVSHKSN
ncbi:MAG: S8 family serine peptidase [bacterium]|nr:S8 family serine peptidase [bacterium]